MKRPIPLRSGDCPDSRFGFTLVELLVATALSLLLLGTVITLFGNVSESITESRSMLEVADRLRLTVERLQLDLAGATVMVNPPGQPGNNSGYLEYIEGPVGLSSTMVLPSAVANNTEFGTATPDSSIGDFDDVLMLTTHSNGRPFVGKFGGTGTIQSDVAEVAWFIRGRTLHRRVLLVAPNADLSAVASPLGFYVNNDISARWNSSTSKMAANTLADLTRRERRFAHGSAFPSLPANGCDWKWTTSGNTFPTLPTMNECSTTGWSTEAPGQTRSLATNLDFWTNDATHRIADNAFIGGANAGSRMADDIILNNVIGFDVKAWDPTANGGQGAYVDLGGGVGSKLGGNGNSLSGLSRVYDTWSVTYLGANARNGLDDDSNNVVDDASEWTNPPPYPIPLRGIQVKIRTFEPYSKQIREVTVEQSFLPQ
jgi:type II secretory pathway component PulJ